MPGSPPRRLVRISVIAARCFGYSAITSIAAATICARRPASVKEGLVSRPAICLSELFLACMSKTIARFAHPSKTVVVAAPAKARKAVAARRTDVDTLHGDIGGSRRAGSGGPAPALPGEVDARRG